MDHQEDFSVTSRAEYIKLARESCARNLNASHINLKHNGKKKSDTGKMHHHNKRTYIDSYDFDRGELDISPGSMRAFMIRTVCAIMLFLTVLMIDKLNIEFQGISSHSIEELVSSNDGITKAENFFVSLIEKMDMKNRTD